MVPLILTATEENMTTKELSMDIYRDICEGAIKNQIKMVKFLLKYPDSWHTHAGDYDTVSTACACSNLGILVLNTHRQMKLASKENAERFLAKF
jgi:hypothetical protein